MLLLRFRDISIPAGESIRRHSEIADEYGYAWWGWLQREQDSVFPEELLVRESAAADPGPRQLLLVHTGLHCFLAATLKVIHARPDGNKVRSPELERTPRYMHESMCSVWFGLSNFRSADRETLSKVVASPTLPTDDEYEAQLRQSSAVRAREFSKSAATLWEVEW